MRYLVLLLAAACALALPIGALGGSAATLHPAGFGPHSYSAWKAHQGLPDTTGSDDQALYFQKMTSTTTVAAGVAVVRGLERTPLSDLDGLSWAHREDGHCGAGAPRWNVTVRDTGGATHTVFLGCDAAVHSEYATDGGHGWCLDTQTSPASQVAGEVGQPASGLTIVGLAIVFDEGNDIPNPPPAGCAQEQPAGGFVYLDDITVTVNGIAHCWTGASDNGGANGACPPPPATSQEAPVASPLDVTVPAGLAVDPLDLGLVNALRLAAPGVPLLAWSLYPNVLP
jgi:hypothetical protein